MVTTVCILILVYLLKGKDIDALVKKLKNVDWHARANRIYSSLQRYSIKYGRKAAKPLVESYHVLSAKETSTKDKAIIYAALIYTLSPRSLISSAKFGLLGLLDEGAAILLVYEKVQERMTPEIESRVNATLNDWFGVEYEKVEPEEVK